MNEPVTVNEYYLDLLNGKITSAIHELSNKERLDDCDIIALKELVSVYELLDFNHLKSLNIAERDHKTNQSSFKSSGRNEKVEPSVPET